MTNGYESRGESQFIDDYGVMFCLGSLSSYWNDTSQYVKERMSEQQSQRCQLR